MNEQNNQQNGSRVKYNLILLVIFILVLFLASWTVYRVFYQPNISGLDVSKLFFQDGIKQEVSNSDKAASFELSVAEARSVYPFTENYYLRQSADSIALLNASGKEALSWQIQCKNPKIVTNDHFALVYDKGGHNYYLFSEKGMIYQANSEDAISLGTISETGQVALILDTYETKGVLRVMAATGQHLFDYQIRDRLNSGFLLGLAFTYDGKFIDLSLLSTDSDQVRTVVNRFDLQTLKITAILQTDGNKVLPYLACGSENNLILCGAQMVQKLENGKLTKWLNYSQIYEASSSKSGLAFLASDVEGASPKLYYVKPDLAVADIPSWDLNEGSLSLLCSNDRYIAVAGKETVYRVDKEKGSVERFETGSGILRLGLDKTGLLTVVTEHFVVRF